MPYEPPPELAGLTLAEIAELVAARKLPPVDQWAPAREGDSLMRIAADGRWYHDGGEITRPAMIRAFASLLWRDEARSALTQFARTAPPQRFGADIRKAQAILQEIGG